MEYKRLYFFQNLKNLDFCIFLKGYLIIKIIFRIPLICWVEIPRTINLQKFQFY